MNDQLQQQRDFWNQMTEEVISTPLDSGFLFDFCKKESRILQYGCGPGITLSSLEKKGFKNVYGVDHSEEMIRIAKDKLPKLREKLAVCDSLEVPFADNSFDVVILMSVLTCITRDQEQKYLIDELERVLKPGGYIYVSDFLLNADEKNLKRYEYNKEDSVYGIFKARSGVMFRHHDADWIKALLNSFQRLDYQTIECVTLNNNKTKGFKFIGKKTA